MGRIRMIRPPRQEADHLEEEDHLGEETHRVVAMTVMIRVPSGITDGAKLNLNHLLRAGPCAKSNGKMMRRIVMTRS